MMLVCAVRCASHPFTAAGAMTLKMKIQKVKLIEQPNKMAVAHEMTVVLDDGVFRCNNVSAQVSPDICATVTGTDTNFPP